MYATLEFLQAVYFHTQIRIVRGGLCARIYYQPFTQKRL